MPESSLIRSIRFRAAHHYRRPDWTEAQNRRAFGDNVESHEHEYVLELAVRGAVDPDTGFLVDLAALDQAIDEVVAPLRGRDLTEAIAEARGGAMLPSTENLARWLFRQLEGRIPGGARLYRVRLAESETLAAEFLEP
jgi:6-pyruvoyltetrahydropterin/6-carboxytetrahydropterin synthase